MSAKPPRIVCIGKATQDIFLKSEEFDPTIEGKVAYEKLPLGAKLEVDEMEFTTGGNATNVAVTFARQGLHAEYLWVLGTDVASEAILRDLDRENVDVSGVSQSAHLQAGYGTILLAPSGERTILSYHGKGPKPGDRQLDLSRIESADWVYPSALHSMELLEDVITRAKHHGVKVMFNPDSKELEQPAKVKGLLEDVDVLCVNKDEAKLLVHGEDSEELVRHLLHHVPVAIVSDGPNGVVASDGKTIVRAGMYQDVKVVDRLGAGDAFASGFLSQWCQGASLKDAIIFASANSTSVVTKIGAKSGILHKGFKLHDMPLTEKPL